MSRTQNRNSVRKMTTVAAMLSGVIWANPRPAPAGNDTKLWPASVCLPESGSPDVERLPQGWVRGLEVGEPVSLVCPLVRDYEFSSTVQSWIRVLETSDDGVNVQCTLWSCNYLTNWCSTDSKGSGGSPGWHKLQFGQIFQASWNQNTVKCYMGFNDYIGSIQTSEWY